MAKVVLSLDLENDQHCARPGGQLTGKVRVKVEADCECRGLMLTARWQTYGEGQPSAGATEPLKLFEGSWQAGDKREYPFSLPAPPGPLTYRGHAFQREWHLEAYADIPWAFDPMAEQSFRLLDGDSEQWLDCGGFHKELSAFNGRALSDLSDEEKQRLSEILHERLSTQGAALGFWGSLAVGLFLVFLCASMLFLDALDGRVDSYLFALSPLIVVAIVVFPMWWDWVARSKFRAVDVNIEPSQLVAPGEAVELVIAVHPSRKVQLNAINLALRCRESFVVRQGKRTVTKDHTVYEWQGLIETNTPLQAGELVEFRHPIRIPDDAAWSFGLASNSLDWCLETHFDIPLWPDFTVSHKLFVSKAELIAPLRSEAANKALKAAAERAAQSPQDPEAEARLIASSAAEADRNSELSDNEKSAPDSARSQDSTEAKS